MGTPGQVPSAHPVGMTPPTLVEAIFVLTAILTLKGLADSF